MYLIIKITIRGGLNAFFYFYRIYAIMVREIAKNIKINKYYEIKNLTGGGGGN